MSERICHIDQLKLEACNPFTVQGKKINLVRNDQGVFAFDNKCPHMGLPLSVGKVEGNTVECRFHKARFNISSGEVDQWANFPPVLVNAINLVCKEKSLTTYPVQINEAGEIFVSL